MIKDIGYWVHLGWMNRSEILSYYR